jgi:hypothetical protein
MVRAPDGSRSAVLMSVCTLPGVPKDTAKSAGPLVKYEEKNTESLFSISV